MTTMSDERLRELYANILSRGSEYPPGSPAPEQILALVQREGLEDERLRILDQVMKYEACRRDFDLLRAVARSAPAKRATAPDGPSASVFEGQDGAQMHPKFARVRRWSQKSPWMTSVTAIAAAAVLAVGITQWRSSGQSSKGVTRTASGNDVVELVSPGDSPRPIDKPIAFVWHASPGAVRYTLEVLYDTGDVAYTVTTSDTSVVVDEPQIHLVANQTYLWWVSAISTGTDARRSEMRILRLVKE